MTGLRGSSRKFTASLWVLTMLAVAASPAVAQQRDATPSATHLWREYPLEATPEAAALRTSQPASRAPTARAERPSGQADGGGGSRALLLTAAGIAAACAAVAMLGWIGWRARRADALPPVRTPLLSAQGAPVPAREPQARRRTGGRTSGEDPPARSAAPPDGALDWTAEIEWHHGPGGPCFRLVASRAGSSERTVVGESQPLEWPPTAPDSVQALRRAVEQLESAAVAAGWSSAAAGRAWYAKRFTWQPLQVPTQAAAARAAPESAAATPVSAQPAPNSQPVGAGRFDRVTAWPEGTKELYRCEIVWDAGYARSAFHAMVFPPGRDRGVAACSSKPFKWLRGGRPDADSVAFSAEVQRLAEAMGAAGWQRAGRGAEWYSHRFVWRRDGPPPERVEPHAVTGAESG